MTNNTKNLLKFFVPAIVAGAALYFGNNVVAIGTCILAGGFWIYWIFKK